MTAAKERLGGWIVDALSEMGGSAAIVDICRWIAKHHESDLRAAGDLYFTWQYDVRWAATNLRTLGQLRGATESPRGVWELS
jgi:hypothetical protein